MKQAVEYYSGMNDEKYMYFTERIQNTLLRPEVMTLMRDRNNSLDSADDNNNRRMSTNSEKKLTKDELLKKRQQEHEERKRARVDKLAAMQASDAAAKRSKAAE